MKENNILKQLNSTVILLTSIVALVAGVWSFVTSMNNKDKIVAIEEGLYDKAKKISETFNIAFPPNCMEIDSLDKTFELYGTYHGNFSDLQNYHLWAVTYNKYGYSLAKEPLVITAKEKWFSPDIFYSYDSGNFTLFIVLTGEVGTNFFDDLLKKGDYTFDKFPNDAIVLDYVEMKKN